MYDTRDMVRTFLNTAKGSKTGARPPSGSGEYTQRDSATNVQHYHSNTGHTSPPTSTSSFSGPSRPTAERNASYGLSGRPVDPMANKKCSVCGKSFNPIRRRYHCRTCAAVVCNNCSISRKVESLYEGPVTVRVCVSCKLSSMSAQDDYYDRMFTADVAIPSASQGGDTSSVTVSSDRVSTLSYHHAPAPGNTGSGSSARHHHSVEKKRAPSVAMQNVPPLRRKSSAASTHSGSTSRADTASVSSPVDQHQEADGLSPPADCHLCLGEVCAPVHDVAEIPYSVTVKNQRLLAKKLVNETERLKSVRILRNELRRSTSMKQTMSQICSMVAIATQSPVAFVGLLDAEEYIIAGVDGGSPPDSFPRDDTFAAHTCHFGAPLVCSDLSDDIRFKTNSLVTDTTKARFYAGVPLTLSNGHIVGAIEVVDNTPRYACTDAIAQLQPVVRGILRKFESVIAAAKDAEPEEPVIVEAKPATRAPAPPVPPRARGPAPTIDRPTTPPPPPPTSAPVVAPVRAPAPAPAALAPTAAPQPTQNEMEMQLLQLLSQTTSTQEQLRNQQGQMVHAISSHTKQISEMARQLERMENTLASKIESVNRQEATAADA